MAPTLRGPKRICATMFRWKLPGAVIRTYQLCRQTGAGRREDSIKTRLLNFELPARSRQPGSRILPEVAHRELRGYWEASPKEGPARRVASTSRRTFFRGFAGKRGFVLALLRKITQRRPAFACVDLIAW